MLYNIRPHLFRLSKVIQFEPHVCTRKISNDYSNKRITRLEGEIELESDTYETRLINRNPLNLEQLNYEKKPSGFWLDQNSPSNYNRLVFRKEGRYLEAVLQHWSGRSVVQASTREPQLAKYFTGTSSIQAATVLAKVVVRRCLMSGFVCAGAIGNEGVKSKTFFETVEASGFCLQESPEIVPRSISDI